MVDKETEELLQRMDLYDEYLHGKVVISDHAASDKYKRWIDVKCYRLTGYALCPYCNAKTYWRWPEARWRVNSRTHCPECNERVYTSEDWFNANVPPKEDE
jgi:hypothetical protein